MRDSSCFLLQPIGGSQKPKEWRPLRYDLFEHPPSILEQTPWPCGIYDFKKSQMPLSPGTDYFNCSFVDVDHQRWLFVRRSKWVQHIPFGMNDIVAFRLVNNEPKNCKPIKIAAKFTNEHFEDPRVFEHDGFLWLSCCNFVWGPKFSGPHQIMVKLDKQFNVVQRFDPVAGCNGSHCYDNHGSEKNWVWFFHDGLPHLVYYANPAKIFRFDNNFVLKQKFEMRGAGPRWDHGQIRSGTPPVRIGDEYWTFFHSSVDWAPGNVRRYYMGVYAFRATPPFATSRMSRMPILTGTPKDRWAERKPYVVFPCGARFNNGHWFITMGVNDLDCGWIEIPHDQLQPLLWNVL